MALRPRIADVYSIHLRGVIRGEVRSPTAHSGPRHACEQRFSPFGADPPGSKGIRFTACAPPAPPPRDGSDTAPRPGAPPQPGETRAGGARPPKASTPPPR